MELERHEYDVVVVGAGGAGLRAAIEAHETGARTAVVCKSLLGKAHTVMAEGGIAAAMANLWPEDNWRVHFRDTMRGGKMLNHWRMAQLHAQEAPDRVRELEDWGALFDRTARRPDQPARLRRPPLRPPRPRRRPHRPGADPHPAAAHRRARHRRLHGVHGHPAAHRRATASPARSATGGSPAGSSPGRRPSVVLATGGIGKSYKVTSNSWEYTGDGHSLALQAGATLVNMEFVQFHPTGMVWPPSVRGILVTESVRGDGGILKNSAGNRFMFDYIPDFFRKETAETEAEADRWYDDKKNNRRPPELLPRDEVARAINSEVKAGRGHAARRRLPRHRLAPVAGVHPQAAAVDVPPVQGAGRGRHHRRGDGGRAHLPLRDGRGGGRPGHRGGPRARACSPPARSPAACTAPTGWAATRCPTCWCSDGGPALAAAEHAPRHRRPGTAARRRSSPTPAAAALAPFDREGGENPYTVQHDLQQTMHDLVGIIRTAAGDGAGAGADRGAQGAGGQPVGRGAPAVQPRLAPGAGPAAHAGRQRVHRPGGARTAGEPRRAHPRRLPRAPIPEWARTNLICTADRRRRGAR